MKYFQTHVPNVYVHLFGQYDLVTSMATWSVVVKMKIPKKPFIKIPNVHVLDIIDPTAYMNFETVRFHVKFV